MTPQQKEALALIDRMHRGARDREQTIERAAMARSEPLDWKRGAPARPRHDMVAKLSAIVIQNAILGDDNAGLSRMNEARQRQQDREAGRSRFSQALGKLDPFVRIDGERSRFMQAAGAQEKGRFAEIRFDGGGRRVPRNEGGRPERGRSGYGERVESVNALEDKAFA
jgi:hypothetical protein